jgi:hypothetical protein
MDRPYLDGRFRTTSDHRSPREHIHRTAVVAVVREIQEGAADPRGRLDELAQRISERAGGHSPD